MKRFHSEMGQYNKCLQITFILFQLLFIVSSDCEDFLVMCIEYRRRFQRRCNLTLSLFILSPPGLWCGTVKNEEEAIALANDSPYGLGGSVFTQDIERGKRVANQIDTGMVFINHPTWTQADLPFGGTKGSGYGREMAELGLDEFVNKKLIRISELSDPF